MFQRLLHLFFILANVKEDGLDSLNIASKVSLRENKVLALCNEAGESGDGNGGAVGGQGITSARSTRLYTDYSYEDSGWCVAGEEEGGIV